MEAIRSLKVVSISAIAQATQCHMSTARYHTARGHYGRALVDSANGSYAGVIAEDFDATLANKSSSPRPLSVLRFVSAVSIAKTLGISVPTVSTRMRKGHYGRVVVSTEGIYIGILEDDFNNYVSLCVKPTQNGKGE